MTRVANISPSTDQEPCHQPNKCPPQNPTVATKSATIPSHDCQKSTLSKSNSRILTKVFSQPHRVFQVFSSLHRRLSLRFHTMFLAREIFGIATAAPKLEVVGRPELAVTAMQLASKFE